MSQEHEERKESRMAFRFDSSTLQVVLSVIELELLRVEPFWDKEDNKLNFITIEFRVTVLYAGKTAIRELNTQVLQLR